MGPLTFESDPPPLWKVCQRKRKVRAPQSQGQRLSRQLTEAARGGGWERSAAGRELHSPSGVAASLRRPELEGARLEGPCWCSGDLMEDRIICLAGLAGSLCCSAAEGGGLSESAAPLAKEPGGVWRG